MLDTLLGRIAGFFDKDFLFSSFLPSLIFLPLVFATSGITVGLEAVWDWIDSRTGTQTAALALAGTLLVVVFAYVLNALRGTFTRVWSGNSTFLLFWGFRGIGEHIQRRRFLRLRDRASRFSTWLDLRDEFRDQVNQIQPVWNAGLPAPPEKKLRHLTEVANRIRQTRKQDLVKLHLRELEEGYRRYSGDALLTVYEAATRALLDRDEEERGRIQNEAHELDRKFGALNTVKATALGNIIESYQQYPSKRYQMESGIFWGRLRNVMPDDYLATVQEPRILLDFALAMASLAAAYCLLALLFGPWIWYKPALWFSLAAASMVLSYFFYRIGVNAAYQHGELIRSSYDLFRLDLMEVLGLPHPANLLVEQAQWAEFSRLAVYGTAANFTIAKRKKK